ncbi:hypothetical protein F3J29_03830 [Enterobacter sp. Cy-643]|uniref:hypothetical protein n=1 Tax=Enterobacter sp. Cy-643 TaxID=2608346 RepID=UPI0014225321|nr:hypothetical protein [Enterobacter sp. Cy-643]NIF31268.1 hypothetical protein [Enterobacter sp. Cy-643]
MNTFERTRLMPQLYRDVYTSTLYLPEADAFPAHLVAEVLTFHSTDIVALEEKINAAQTGYPPEQERALKLLMRAIILANGALNNPMPFEAEKAQAVTQWVVEALQLSQNKNFLIAAVQILFRINEVNSAVFLISNNLSELENEQVALKILLLICLMEDDYNQAYVVIQQLTSNSDLIGEDPLTLVMVVCAIYKLGGIPDSFIDFRPLANPGRQADTSRYRWLIHPTQNGKTTAVIGCDKAYFYEHGVPLLLSIYDTNRDSLNVHFHIYNSDSQLETDVASLRNAFPELAISHSSEIFIPSKNHKVHYASRRLAFMPHALEKFHGPLLMLDADSLVIGSLPPLLDSLNHKELTIAWRDAAPFWEEFKASFIYTEGGELAKTYFARVANFIDGNLASGNAELFLGQIGLACALHELSAVEQMAVGREPLAQVSDAGCSDNAFSWAFIQDSVHRDRWQQHKTALREKYRALVE